MSVPKDLELPLKHTRSICRAFLSGLKFIVLDTSRHISFWDNHLLSYTAQDFYQSAFALPILANEGIQNVCRRELRFILEMSIKLCFIQQSQYSSKIISKLSSFDSILDSSKISIKNQISLDLLPQQKQSAFSTEVGQFYGETSNYVHLTTTQIKERIEMVDAGRTSGLESPDDVDLLNMQIERGLAYSLVYLFHSVPSNIAGDWFVNSDGKTVDWLFAESKYIAAIDEYFDYKAERQSKLEEIRDARQKRVRF